MPILALTAQQLTRTRKNYRKPLLQRYVIRILLMYESTTEKFMHTLIGYRVPIYSIASWCSIISLKVAMFVDPIRDVYEVMRVVFLSS
jgi:hypothetical protein